MVFRINNDFLRYQSSLEAHAALSRDLVTFYQKLKDLLWLEDIPNARGEFKVQQKIDSLSKLLFGNDSSSYLNHFKTKIKVSYVRYNFENMNEYFSRLEVIKDLFIDEEKKDLYQPLKDEYKEKIGKKLDDSVNLGSNEDESFYTKAQDLLIFFENYREGESCQYLGEELDGFVE